MPVKKPVKKSVKKPVKKPVKKKKARTRRKHCPICKEEQPMSVMREAEPVNDLCWLLCPSCDGKFALTRQQYTKEKQPDISAAEKSNAKTYRTDRTYKIGELIYHPKLTDLGWIVDKVKAPIADCSGAIIVSFIEKGPKTLIEGYTVA